MFSKISLSDGVVTLRPFYEDDLRPFYTAIHESLEALIPWMSWAHTGYTEKDAENYIRMARNGWDAASLFVFAITDAQSGDMLGAVSLSHIHPIYHFCNLGYWVRSSRRGNGIAGRAARLAAQFGFERVSLIRVEVVIAAGNTASIKAAEKMGAHHEGILRSRITVREKIHNAVMFSFVPADFVAPLK